MTNRPSCPAPVRIAVVSPIDGNAGGSFQYAEMCVEALAGLDRERFDLRVWYGNPAWEPFLKKVGIYGVLRPQSIDPETVRRTRAILAKGSEDPPSEEEKAWIQDSFDTHSGRRAVMEYAPDIVVFPQMMMDFTIPGAKHVGVIHDLMHKYAPQFPEVGSPAEVSARDVLFNKILSHCDTVFVDSPTGAGHVLESYPHARAEQLRVLPFAVPREIMRCAPRKPEGTIPEKFFFYPAQFWKHKNHVNLARAVARLAGRLPDIHVVLVGNTAHNGYDDFMNVVRACGLEARFSLPGYVPLEEIAWYYRNARALVMPTFFGPTNIPPLEAMALGCPVAVSGIYGMPESYGDAALYFDPGRVGEMAEIMRRLWEDETLRDSLREKGIARAAKFSFEAFEQGVRRTIEELASAVMEAPEGTP